MSIARIRLLDELAANATAATTVQVVDGWLARRSPGLPFHRSNCVLTHRGGRAGLADRIAAVESFYRACGLPAQFQVSPGAHPRELDEALAARGYAVEAPTLVLTTATRTLARYATTIGPWPATASVETTDDPIERHADLHARDDVARARFVAYSRMLRDIGPATVCASVADGDGRSAAVGFGTLERGWLGVYAMATRPDARRRGAASAVLGALAGYALDAGASRSYLLVSHDNRGAIVLYERAGFRLSHRYHYRRREVG